MKQIRLLLAIIFFNACANVSQPTLKVKAGKPWETKIIRRQKHLYNKSGLADTSYRVEQYFVHGLPAGRINFVIARMYNDKNNLLQEKIYQQFEKKFGLSEETSFQYDDQNNLITSENVFQDIISKVERYTYNNLQQKIEETIIQKMPDINPPNWNIDSVMAHHNEKKSHQYDTSVINYAYNSNGGVIQKNYLEGTMRGFKKIIVFSGNQKLLMFDVNAKKDTVLITKYQYRGDFVTEIQQRPQDNLRADTIIYENGRKIYEVHIDKMVNYRKKDTFQYDEKGNETENITYK